MGLHYIFDKNGKRKVICPKIIKYVQVKHNSIVIIARDLTTIKEVYVDLWVIKIGLKSEHIQQ